MQTMNGVRALVTGAGGFIGSHLVERLVHDGARVRAFVHYRGDGQRGWLETSTVAADVEFVAGDLVDSECVRKAAEGIDVIFHLGALISIPYSYVAPRSYLQVNVEGTMNVLEAARAHGISRLVHTSTSEVYGTPDSVPITENHPLKGQSPYSASKIAADKIAESYFCTWQVPVVVLRPFNTFGPRQSARAVLPTILSQLLAGATTLRLGALSPRRDLTFVSDTVDGFVRAALAAGAVGRTVHLGTGRDVSIGELARLAMDVVGREVRIESEPERVRPAGSEVERLLSAPDRAAELLGWRPLVDLREGLQRTAEWIARNPGAFRAGAYAV
jgi:NAD dependent epimerase/dehydratase